MPPGLTMRLATPDDAEAIHAGLLGIGETVDEVHKIKSTPDDIRRYGFGETPAFNTLIAEIDSEFAGMCLYFPIFSTWMGRPGVYVQDLFVDRRFRGMRLGEKLLRRCAKLSKDAGGVYLSLSVDVDNETAKGFYERIGIGVSSNEQIHKILGDDFFAFAEAED